MIADGAVVGTTASGATFRAGPGTMLGDNEALTGVPYAYTAVCEAPAAVIALDPRDIWDAADDHFHVARAVLAASARRLLRLQGRPVAALATTAARRPALSRGPGGIMLTAFRFPFLLAVAAMIARSAAAQPSGPDGNLPLPAPELQRRMQNEPFEIVAVGKTHGGIMTTEKVTMAFPDGTKVKAKWKEAPSDGEGWNNSPRRELAAYTVQQLFLDPDDYIVPPVAVRCIPFDDYRPISKTATPDPAAHEVRPRHALGVAGERAGAGQGLGPEALRAGPALRLSLRQPQHPHRPDQASRRQAKQFPDLHRRAQPADLLGRQRHQLRRHVYNFFTWHFDQIRVGGLPKQSIERLQQVKPEQLERLAVLLELQPDAEGILRPAPATPGTNRDEGVRMVGNGIQFGLTTEEIAAINQRMQALLADVRDGKEQVF